MCRNSYEFASKRIKKRSARVAFFLSYGQCRTFGPSPKGTLRSYFLAARARLLPRLAVHTQDASCNFSARPFPYGVGPSEKEEGERIKYISGIFEKGKALILLLSSPVLCKHSRLIIVLKYRIIYSIFSKISLIYLRMCNFYSTFVADLIWMSVRIRAMMCFYKKKRT